MSSILTSKELVSDELIAVDNLIFTKIKSQSGLIDELSHHLIKSGGKKLRPMVVLLSSLACGYQGQEHIKLAAMIEFFHNATLLHDDVVDDSKLRRGRQTANNIWGSKASILVGDFLFTLYIDLMLQVGNMKIMRLLSNITHEVTCGEIKQLANKHKYSLSIEEYFTVIKSKTSILFAASATIGAIINNAPTMIENSLYDFGLHLGNAFQLIDDVLDYCSDTETLGKNIGDDLAEGKATLPLIYILQNGNQQQIDLVKESLQNGDITNLQKIVDILSQSEAINYTKQIAKQEIDMAVSALDILPESKYKNALKNIANYAICRAY